MPRTDQFYGHYAKTVASVAGWFKEFPPVDQAKLSEIEDAINALWISESGSWNEFQVAVGKWRMEFFRVRGG